LYDKVTLYCSNEIAGEWKRRNSKTICRAWPNEFWLKQKKFSSYSSDPWNLEEFLNYLAVRLEWTHVVSIFEANGTMYLICSCCGFEQNGYCCECICAVVNEAPKPAHVVIRWQKPYFVLHLTGNRDLTRHLTNWLRMRILARCFLPFH
jgi:hypothetical protein